MLQTPEHFASSEVLKGNAEVHLATFIDEAGSAFEQRHFTRVERRILRSEADRLRAFARIYVAKQAVRAALEMAGADTPYDLRDIEILEHREEERLEVRLKRRSSLVKVSVSEDEDAIQATATLGTA